MNLYFTGLYYDVIKLACNINELYYGEVVLYTLKLIQFVELT